MELHLFDFDGTLFKSPEYVPDFWEVSGEYSWFSHPISLTEPCIPLIPPSEWWIQPTVKEAKKSLRNKNSLTIICTGRVDAHEPRVKSLLNKAGLGDFKHFFFNPGISASQFKKTIIQRLHERHNFTAVHIWENENYAEYKRFVEGTLGIPCVIHKVDVPHIPYTCDVDDVREDGEYAPIKSEREMIPTNELRVADHNQRLARIEARLRAKRASRR